MARRSHDSKRIEWADRLRRHTGSVLSISAFLPEMARRRKIPATCI